MRGTEVGIKVDFSQLDYGAIDNKLRGRPDDVQRLVGRNEQMATALGGRVRTSQKGVPHVVVTKSGTTYSVCYFAKQRLWRVFFPWPSWGAVQTKEDFDTTEEVIKYFNDIQ